MPLQNGCRAHYQYKLFDNEFFYTVQVNAMEDIDVIDIVNDSSHWLDAHQDFIVQSVINAASAVLIAVAGFFLAKVIAGSVGRVMKLHDVEPTVADFLSAMLRYSVLAFTLVAVLGCFGVQTASIIAVIGAAGLAVGLALQGSLSNVAAGIMLVLLRPFRCGEYVDAGGAMGTVTQVQIFSTTLCTPDGKLIVIPNSKIVANNIINFTREPECRTDMIIDVAYHADIDVVKKVLGGVIAADKRVVHDRGVTIRLNAMTAASLSFIVSVWTRHHDAQEVFWDLMENFKRVLDANNLNIA